MVSVPGARAEHLAFCHLSDGGSHKTKRRFIVEVDVEDEAAYEVLL
jgi:hypothetical protein